MIPRGLLRHAHRVLFLVIAAALIVALARQFALIGRPPEAVAFGLTLIYLGWLISEAPVTFARRDPSAPVDTTLLPYALARSSTAVAAVLSPLPWTGWAWWMAVPAALFVGAIALRLWAIRVLGRFYSHHVTRQQGHAVVTDGPYTWIRHPAYTGMLVANMGFVAFFPSVFSLTALVLLAAALMRRIRTEEKMLMTIPGYAGYAASTARLLPGLW